MSWNRPKTASQWLLLFAPAAICVISTVLGGLINPEAGNWMAWSLIGLMLASAFSLGLTIWLVRGNASFGSGLGSGILCFGILMIINFAVCFAGCAVGSTILPGMSFH